MISAPSHGWARAWIYSRTVVLGTCPTDFLKDNLKLKLCFAPAVGFLFLHGEIYKDRVTDATSKTVRPRRKMIPNLESPHPPPN